MAYNLREHSLDMAFFGGGGGGVCLQDSSLTKIHLSPLRLAKNSLAYCLFIFELYIIE